MAVCVIVRDEAHLIAEWLAYQVVLGFDACLVYDNGSVDGTTEIVRRSVAHQDIRLIEWMPEQKRIQDEAYNDAIRRFGAEFEWIAFFDADEFLVLHEHEAVGPFLADPRHRNYSAIGVNWAVFGSAGHLEQPSGLLIEQFTRRSPVDFDPNRHIKSIVRPSEFASFANAHVARVSGDYGMAGGAPFPWTKKGLTEQPSHQSAQLNHYFVQSAARWQLKLKRGYRWGLVRDSELFAAYDRNEVEDRSALKYAPQLKHQLAKSESIPL